MTRRPQATATIGPVTVDDLTLPELIDRAKEAVATGSQLRIFYVNAHTLRLAARDSHFARALEQGDLRFCDGYGILLAARLLGSPIRQRMTPPDWIDELIAGMQYVGGKLYLLGDEASVVCEAAQEMSARMGAKVMGHHHGYFPESGLENEQVVSAVNGSGANVLLVGMGAPRQERWIVANAPRLQPSLIIAVGGLFRWVAGVERRTATYRWMAAHGLEWAARLGRHPRTYFGRYVLGLPYVALLVGRELAGRNRQLGRRAGFEPPGLGGESGDQSGHEPERE